MRILDMTFTYPAIFTEENGTYIAEFPDLEGIHVEKDSLDSAIDEARDAMYNWLLVEFEEEQPVLPEISDIEELELKPNQHARNILVHFRFHTGWDE